MNQTYKAINLQYLEGCITAGYLYAPFGEILQEHLAVDNRIPKYAFNAKEFDEENGMYYYSARYYSPPSFISRDELFEKTPFMSPYAYCNNNPVVRIDPDGNWSGRVHKKMITRAVNELADAGILKFESENDKKAMIKGMVQGSVNADKNQKPKDSHIHYMKDPKISSEQAKENAKDYVNKNIADFKKTGDFKSLGQAAHTMMDAVCPTHATKNTDGSYEPILNDLPDMFRLDTKVLPGAYKWIKHGMGDINPTDAQMNEAVGNVKAVILEGMGLKNNPNQQQGQGEGLIDP
ncbi:MAG: RHS repeat-associated core domain-containing protein [Bacteroidales bacterium]|nr:RHS repeat-associated core domain-containing protein [Bacteroidales bacterium]